MATNPPRKPPDHDTATTTEFNHVSSSASSSLLLKQRRSTCSCSNIAIMQLFHEMKQKFPTVPDHVVSDLVTANCHNRPACIDSLEKAVAGTPATAQAYPSQVIHNTSLKRRINERKLRSMEHSFSGGSSGSSSRESSVDKTSSGCGSRFHNNNNASSSSSPAEVPRDGNVNNADNQHPASTMTTSSPAFDNNTNPPPNRPNTLAFSGPRPTRVAPPIPPISSTITASPELGETVNVQLNVTVSPVASRSPLGQRHTSVLQLQPESPYSRELAQASTTFNAATGPLPPGANSRSSTSVNLTLRQPSETPQSPIHIHASPLKYTAKGFNAQSGIQSKLEITFRDGFGSISAMRTHVPGFEQQQQGVAALVADNHHYQEQQMAVNAAQLENDGLERAQRYENYLTEVAITHQLDQKNRLSEEVDRYRYQLESIRREIRILQHPLCRSDADQLGREVQLLEEEVDLMQKEVDQQQAQLSIEGSPSQPTGPYVNRPPRPPRPPPPKFSTSHQQLPAAAAVASADGGRYQGGRSISAPALPHDPQQQQPHPAIAGEQWTCSLCTFQNHELMTRCEVCSLPKMPGRLSSQSSLPPSSSSSPPSSSSAAVVAAAAAPASASLLVAASAPVATAVVLQTSAAVGSPSSSSSSSSSTASTPQTQPAPPPIQSAQFQKSSIEC
ncbi:hypothetical protein pipiens_013442 [Culex pipiens pipiens]|uniref:RanBP2-type domain-containing protein n=1 Tax=Culex pipiens pipiens TaxID=38569 RepID=A0ABD1CYD9_CULPP